MLKEHDNMKENIKDFLKKRLKQFIKDFSLLINIVIISLKCRRNTEREKLKVVKTENRRLMLLS